MIIKVHHLEYSRSVRALWLLEELGLAYEIKRYARHPKTFRAPPELEEVHPLGRAPIVEVDGLVLAESGAIIEHFVEAEGKLGPTTPEERHQFRFWMHYAEGSVMAPLVMRLITDTVRRAKMPFFIKPVAKAIAKKIDDGYPGPEIERHFAFIESELASRDYFCGDAFTAADIQMLYPIEGGAARGRVPMPNAKAWLARVAERPAYQRALKKGGPAVRPDKA